MSETSDNPAKPDKTVEPDTPANAEVSAQEEVSAKTEAEAKADNAEKLAPAAAPDAPAKAETTAKTEAIAKPNNVEKPAPEAAAKTDNAEKPVPGDKAKAVKADKAPGAQPAADSAAKVAKADSTDKPAKPAKAESADKPAKPAKPAAKQKPEDKPFADFIQEDLLPALTKSLTERESAPISLALVEGERPVVGGQCWMVQGELPAGRRFWLCFASDAITSGKTIALAESGSDPSLLESFLIDEKRINQALLESRLLQRLNGQKWFGGN